MNKKNIFKIVLDIVMIALFITFFNKNLISFQFHIKSGMIFGALILVLTGAFMLFTHGNEWIVSLTIAAILQLYTSIRIPQEEEKELKGE